jgi:dienelactone hydrolase
MNNKSSTASQRAELWSLLGDLPDRNRAIKSRTVWNRDLGSFSLERITLELNGIEDVPAYFARPNGTGPFPAVLYNHAHGGNYALGKEELIRGSDALQKPAYAEVLTSSGYAVLCIDHWCFGERRGLSESERFKMMLWHGQVLWGMMIFDSVRAIDYLATRPDVDFQRIGTVGLSMGSTMAWWVAALDERITVCVDLCCLTDFQALIDNRSLDRHGVYYYVPGLLKSFSTASINSLIAPRPHLSLAGTLDSLTPAAGLERVDTELKRVYADHKKPDAWQLFRTPTGHLETAEMRCRVIEFLRKWL